jgi:hypothetical protein
MVENLEVVPGSEYIQHPRLSQKIPWRKIRTVSDSLYEYQKVLTPGSGIVRNAVEVAAGTLDSQIYVREYRNPRFAALGADTSSLAGFRHNS